MNYIEYYLNRLQCQILFMVHVFCHVERNTHNYEFVENIFFLLFFEEICLLIISNRERTPLVIVLNLEFFFNDIQLMALQSCCTRTELNGFNFAYSKNRHMFTIFSCF